MMRTKSLGVLAVSLAVVTVGNYAANQVPNPGSPQPSVAAINPVDSTNVAKVVAVVFGKNISAAEVGLSETTTVNAASKQLLDLIWREVNDRYAQKEHLVATDQECEAYEKFLSASMARQAEKRKQELSQIDLQLKADNLPETKRNELEQNRKSLLSVASLDSNLKTIPQETMRNISRQWVTAYKVYKAAYERYGGKVATTAFGLYPIEARRKLIEEHISAGDIRFVDADFELQFWKSYEKGGRFVVEKEPVDFTPYWLKPIPNDSN